jgi:hypothetical protein
MMDLERRYETDMSFRRLVQGLYNLASSEEVSGLVLRDACLMAQYLLELHALRSLHTGSQVDRQGYRSRVKSKGV